MGLVFHIYLYASSHWYQTEFKKLKLVRILEKLVKIKGNVLVWLNIYNDFFISLNFFNILTTFQRFNYKIQNLSNFKVYGSLETD